MTLTLKVQFTAKFLETSYSCPLPTCIVIDSFCCTFSFHREHLPKLNSGCILNE